MRLSYGNVFEHNTSSQGHGYIFHSMINILKVESETSSEKIEQRWFQVVFASLVNMACKTIVITTIFLFRMNMVKHYGWGRISANADGKD